MLWFLWNSHQILTTYLIIFKKVTKARVLLHKGNCFSVRSLIIRSADFKHCLSIGKVYRNCYVSRILLTLHSWVKILRGRLYVIFIFFSQEKVDDCWIIQEYEQNSRHYIGGRILIVKVANFIKRIQNRSTDNLTTIYQHRR